MTEKKTKGRKRHIAVDTMGNLLAVVVHVANIHDTKAGIWAAKLGAEAIGTASEYGLHFPQVFKTITVDNGNEFAGFA